ncbi:MAG: hypothetical protein EA408_13355 [Marinilabiliales bacterium]|nr:MAG: hypothetical protein EA408_13355 [Marinilabiliales bacterium]
MLRIIKENINGILGTVIFHLLLAVIVMAAKLTSVDNRNEISLLIEFAPDITEEEFRALTESLMANEGRLQDDASNMQSPRNIAVNISEERPVPDQFRDMSPEQMSELDSRVDEILNNAANGQMPVPDQPDIEFEPVTEIINLEEEDYEPYSGPTTITYELTGRNHIRIPVPVYRCPDGGVVNVNISVDRQGRVVRATIDGNPSGFNEICIHETAVEASLASRFNQDPDAPPVQSGMITFYFQQQ